MSAILNFNSGSNVCLEVMTNAGLLPGKTAQQKFMKKTLKRVKKVQHKSSKKAKHHRQVVQEVRSREEERRKQAEGVTYSSGDSMMKLYQCQEEQEKPERDNLL